jgi:hypothetical protein
MNIPTNNLQTHAIPPIEPESSSSWLSLVPHVPPLSGPSTFKMGSILKSLRISDETKAVIEEHARVVGVDCRRFTSGQDDQGISLGQTYPHYRLIKIH